MVSIAHGDSVAPPIREDVNHLIFALDAVGEAVAVTTPDNRVVFANAACESLSGYSRAELIGQPITVLVMPGAALVDDDMILTSPGRRWKGEAIGVRKSGETFLAEMTTTLVGRDGPETLGRIVALRDISELKRTTAALHRIEARNRALMDASLDLVLRIGGDGTILDCRGAEGDLSLHTRSWAGRKVFEVMPGDAAERVWFQVTRTLQTGRAEVVGFQLPVGLPERGAHDCEARIVPSGDGEALAVVRDVTQRKSLEGQLLQAQKMGALGELASGMAHDFSNLMMPIIGCADLAARILPQEAEPRAYLQEIQRVARRASRLARQLLGISRLQPIERRTINLNDLILSTGAMLRRLIGENIELVTVPAPGPPTVNMDPGRLEQVLVNLALNARDAMPEGGRLVIETANVTVDDPARQHPRVPTGDYAVMSVTDTGVGMTQEVKSRAMEPFFTTKDPGEGTGLGLSTSYDIVVQSGGYITLDSELGKGTTVTIYLSPADEPGDLPPVSDDAGQSPRGDETVLVVEDDPAVREIVAHVLRRQGYAVLEAANGQEALDMGRQHANEAIHLLLTDVVMPLVGGRELVERLRESHPEARSLYISGYGEASLARIGALEPKAEFLPKPFAPALLARRVRQLLDG